MSESVAAAPSSHHHHHGASSSSHPHPRARVWHSVDEVRTLTNQLKREGKAIGFVPTMGALHAGHVALAERSMKETDVTVVSIFVNPTQFLPHEDLSSYPRTLDADLDALQRIGVPYVFAPSVAEMYPSYPDHVMYVDMAGADNSPEGRMRPGHFKGVATVVAKLWNIVTPHISYFGQKDGMQCIVLRRLAKDLNFPTEVRVSPTVRDHDGLALSSRNVYLSQEERSKATVLYRSLAAANDAFRVGERDASTLRQIARSILESVPEGRIDYVSIASAQTGMEVEGTVEEAVRDKEGIIVAGGCMLSVAVKLGKPRLIDNCILGEPIVLPQVNGNDIQASTSSSHAS